MPPPSVPCMLRVRKSRSWSKYTNLPRFLTVFTAQNEFYRFGSLAPAFAFGGKEEQKRLLEKEGVTVNDDFTVDLKKWLMNPNQ